MTDRQPKIMPINREDDLSLLIRGDIVVGNATCNGSSLPRGLFVFAGFTPNGEDIRLLQRPHYETTVMMDTVVYIDVPIKDIIYGRDGSFSFPDVSGTVNPEGRDHELIRSYTKLMIQVRV
ncbi:MAG TPA: hypothetical protein VJI98_04570 [Candidatus Nanoarchaeia archaeon]|nr:hypothetical protein [Candidatus Nanoarchaeia archaeon]